ncbi:MAG: hypothetical protein Q7J54_00035 [Candidatus Woesearchaeota archaeon]|nr:hypothetical protein [Candidatus Woesearchaeota archaeon]
MEKEKVRPIYSELQGYLSQAPKLDTTSTRTSDSVFWIQINNTINELNKITEKNYDSFRLSPEIMRGNGMNTHEYIHIATYRLKLGGLIAKLHGEFFSEEPAPFSGMPSTIINQTQQQNQSLQVQMLLEMQEEINKKIQKTEDPQEKTFLEKIKSSLSSVKNAAEFVALVLKVGNDLGLTIQQIMKLFY